MPLPGVDIQTAVNPALYHPQQIELACRVAWAFQRGTFVLCIPPPCETCDDGSTLILGRDFCPDCGRENDNGRTD